jgi:hypothetical protein
MLDRCNLIAPHNILIDIYIYIYTPIKNKNLGRTVALPSPQRAPPLREEGLKLPKIINKNNKYSGVQTMKK